MAIEIPRELIEHILLGSGDSRRQLQDSPILIDVWVEFAKNPDAPADLLITSHQESTSNELAAEIYRGISRPEGAEHDPVVAPLQNFVAARLYFGEVLQILVPLTSWWQDDRTQSEFDEYDSARSPKLTRAVDDIIDLRSRWLESPDTAAMTNRRSAFERFVALCTLVCLAGLDSLHENTTTLAAATTRLMQAPASDIRAIVLGLLQSMKAKPKPMVRQIALNRRATAAIARSVPTVKADAAQRLFNIDCAGIDWAVLDTGVDEKHPAFGERVKATYDFTNYREIVSLGNERQQVRKMNLETLKEARGGKLPTGADGKLKKIGQAAAAGQPLPLDLVTDMVRLTDPETPVSVHGTHVAGIIAASKYTDPQDARIRRRHVSGDRHLRLPCPQVRRRGARGSR